jgi:hypothetical protein
MTNITITITLEQAQTALDCIDRDMDYSTHDQPNYRSVIEMLHNLHRAELAESLKIAIRNAKEIK